MRAISEKINQLKTQHMANSTSFKNQCRLAFIPLLVFLFSCSQPTSGQGQSKYGDVAKKVAMMLQDDHFSRHRFDDEMSAKVLDTYLEILDFRRIYFTQGDIDKFNKKYRTSIDDQIQNEAIPAANEIYEVYEQRVGAHVAFVEELMKNQKFNFDSDRTVRITRKEAPYPQSDAEQKQIWKNLIEESLLREELAAATEKREAAKNGEEPDERDDPKEKILKRYRTFHKDVIETETEDVTTLFLKAISKAYDPHSEYFSQSQFENFQIQMGKNLKGIGAQLSIDEDDNTPVVRGLVIGGPAHKAGELKDNDKIIGVGQGDEEIVDVVGKKLNDTVDLIRGDSGTVVTLKVRRKSKILTIKIVRDQVDLKESLATADLIQTTDPNGEVQLIGWLRLPSFYSSMDGGQTSMTTDVRRLLSTMIVKGMDGLVVDLRDNGGGSLEEAIKMTGLFIPKGPVVQTVDWRQKTETRRSNVRNPYYKGPMVVLTNRASASASEIFAAALQDYKRAVVIGEKSTFGKGTVQQLRGVYNNRRAAAGALKFTIQTFYRINGDSTQLKGVIPDLQLPSIYDVEDFGESSLKNPLQVEPIAKAKYEPYSSAELPIESLKAAMVPRIANDKDFNYIVEDVAEEKARMAKNQLSLNKKVRSDRLKELEAKSEKRKQEKIARYEKMRKDEEGKFDVFTITLDNFQDVELTRKKDISEAEMTGMTHEEKADEDLTAAELREKQESKQLEYPHLLDPYERETIRILQDLISIRETGKTIVSKVSQAPRVQPVPAGAGG